MRQSIVMMIIFYLVEIRRRRVRVGLRGQVHSEWIGVRRTIVEKGYPLNCRCFSVNINRIENNKKDESDTKRGAYVFLFLSFWVNFFFFYFLFLRSKK